MKTAIEINRAPVLTLWAAVVAERIGFDRDEALTLGRAVAGLNAQLKARGLGLVRKKPAAPGALTRRSAAPSAERLELLGRSIPVLHTPHGLRAAKDGKPDSPPAVARYLETRFGDALEPARAAMTKLAHSFTTNELGARAFSLYEAFRPTIPAGTGGWGLKGVLDLAKVAALAQSKKPRG